MKKKALWRENVLQFLLCPLCARAIYWLTMSYKYETKPVVEENSVISCMEEKSFVTQGDANLFDALSYTSPSIHLARQ